MPHARNFARLALLAFGLATTSSVASAQALPGTSPFLPTAAGAENSAGAKYQLGGIIATGKDVMVSITRLGDKQSFWIPVGGTVNEVTVVSCEPARDEATIRAGGESLTLRLRQSVVLAGNNVPAPVATGTGAVPGMTPPLPPPSGPPEVQEREARMLVTDLLDIGQQHRKAYEEAQRKAAEEKKKAGGR